MSWGAILGTIIPAVEDRLSTAIILAGGIINAGRPEANPLNYVPRIRLPYLMLSELAARIIHACEVETSWVHG